MRRHPSRAHGNTSPRTNYRQHSRRYRRFAQGGRASVRSQTPEAHEAVLDASIPQTAAIRRDAGANLSVAYDGTPQFKDVPESAGVAYAVNTLKMSCV